MVNSVHYGKTLKKHSNITVQYRYSFARVMYIYIYPGFTSFCRRNKLYQETGRPLTCASLHHIISFLSMCTCDLILTLLQYFPDTVARSDHCK